MEDIRGNQYPAPFRPSFGAPEATGLYDPRNEHDNCGVGFVANIKGVRSHQIVDDADRILRHMDHRGACGCESNTGDGAGMLTALPHTFLARVAKSDIGVDLPEAGKYGAGIVFLPQDETHERSARRPSKSSSLSRDRLCWDGVRCQWISTKPTSASRLGPAPLTWRCCLSAGLRDSTRMLSNVSCSLFANCPAINCATAICLKPFCSMFARCQRS